MCVQPVQNTSENTVLKDTILVYTANIEYIREILERRVHFTSRKENLYI